MSDSITYTLQDDGVFYLGSDNNLYILHKDGTYELFPEPVVPYLTEQHKIQSAKLSIQARAVHQGLEKPLSADETRKLMAAPTHIPYMECRGGDTCNQELLDEFLHYRDEMDKMITACTTATDDGEKLIFTTPLVIAQGQPNEHQMGFVYHHSDKAAHLAHLAHVREDMENFIEHIRTHMAESSH